MTCPPDHKHNKTCYGTHGCRCDTCRECNRTSRARYRKLVAYGRPTSDLIDATPAREHIAMLRQAGMGQGRIAELAGIPDNIIRHILYGTSGIPPARKIRAHNAAAILTVQPDPELMLMRDARGAHRRLRALATQGWTFANMAEYLGVRTEGVHSYLESTTVTHTTHRRIAELYETLWDKKPVEATRGDRTAAARMRALAKRNRWVPPLGWDDIDNDPEPPAPLVSSAVTAREVEVARLHAYRWGDRRIAAELGVADQTVLRIRKRLGLAAWTKEQQEAA